MVPGVPVSEQLLLDMVMVRNLIATEDETTSEAPIRYTANYNANDGEPWAKLWSRFVDDHTCPDTLPGFVIVGHDAPRGFQQYRHAWGIDTNCCNGGQLTACILPGKELVQVDAFGDLHETDDGAARKWKRLRIA